MRNKNLEILRRVVDALDDLVGQVVFVGGTTVELYSTDPAAPESHPTKDVDVIT